MTATASGNLQRWSTGHTLPNHLRVLVTRLGLPVEGVAVRWSTVGSRGVVTPGQDSTGPDGVAITRFTLGTEARDYQIQAAVDGAGGSPVTFTATAYPNFAAQLSIAGGNDQAGTVGTPLAEPLSVLVGDEFNNAFGGAAIEWTVLAGDATVSPGMATSAADGLARTVLTLGSAPGPVTVRASFPGTAGREVFFALTATP